MHDSLIRIASYIYVHSTLCLACSYSYVYGCGPSISIYNSDKDIMCCRYYNVPKSVAS